MSLSLGWRRAFSVVLVVAAFAFLGAEIVQNAERLRDFQWQIRPLPLLVSIIGLAGVFLWGIFVWQVLLRRLSIVVAFRPLARAWFLANFSRYIPGMIWQFISMAKLGASTGLTPATAVTSLLAHVGFSLLAAVLIAVYLLPLSLADGLGDVLRIMRLVAPAGLLLVHPRVFRYGLAIAARVLRRETLDWRGTWLDGLMVLALSAVSWLLYGAAFYLFLLSFVALPLTALPAVVAMNAFAFIVGYLAFFAPGGLGFKEGALAVLLAGLIPRPVAFSLAIASRLWTIAAEVVAALFYIRSAKPDSRIQGTRVASR